ncbi:GFA family protein [uncultured Deefgea sp.]|uniref:GFA family protein n=1 Tax=uncultured Deefgea sp. TaxID=1304914 RepID=UPI00260A9431|nr:GFA family protein [uncultured Deefgea sp.]
MKKLQFVGGCLCGNVRYAYSGPILDANYCHCTDCRRVTGSAFNVGVRIRAAEFIITQGEVREFTKQGDSGNSLTRHFCGNCGSPLYTSSPLHDDFLFIKAGSLDDSSAIVPTDQSWISSAVSWANISPDLPQHQKESGQS